MKSYEDFIDGLVQDVDIPDRVWSGYARTLEDIKELSEKRKGEHYMGRNHTTGNKRWGKAAVAAVVLVACGSVFFASNPAIASKIPVIGKIFEQMKEDVTYSGDYDGTQVLQDVTRVMGNEDYGAYVVKNQGITITASEVYCDGYSIYLTAKIESEKGGFDRIPSHYTRRFEEKTCQSVNTEGTWERNEEGEEFFPHTNVFEGKTVDNHTFIGMMKLDWNGYSGEDGVLHLNFSEILYDDENAMQIDGIEPANGIKGSWKLTVPFTVDKAGCKEIPVNKENKEGYRIDRVFVSPYQLIVFAGTPYTTLSPDTYTEEDFEKVWGRKNKEIAAQGGTQVTYEEILAKKYYDGYGMAVYNEDGESIEAQYGGVGGTDAKTVFAIQGHELSKLHIYMSDEEHDMDLIKASDEEEAKENSLLDVKVNLK